MALPTMPRQKLNEKEPVMKWNEYIGKTPKKVKAVLLLCAICFALQSLFDETTSVAKRRGLGCKPINNDDAIRVLSKRSHLTNQVIAGTDRDLETVYDPCITDFPDGVEQYEVDDELAAEKDEPDFTVADVGLDFSAEPDENGTISLAPDAEEPLDEAERTLVKSFDTTLATYDAELAVERATVDEQTIAYVVSLTGCPGWYEPVVDTTSEPEIASELYEASAILKSEVCTVTDKAAENRKLGRTRKLDELGEQPSAADMEYTMHAMLHPMSIECPVEGTSGETYDRVQLLQSENYKVEILGHPINDELLQENGHDYISQNIANDVGIRDSMKLNAWTLVDHAAVVMLDYVTVLREPLDQEIDLLLSNENFKGLYIPMKPDEGTGKYGVDTGFMIIKPNVTEYQNIIDEYLKTPYDPLTGWNNEGFNGFPGELGLPGFLAYYFNKDPGYIPVDRCTYAYTADDDCLIEVTINKCKAVRVYEEVCGNPRTCPYDNPHWSPAKQEACAELHRTYFEHRYSFEETYFNKTVIQERIGMFKAETFLGYCTGPGGDSYLSMTGAIIPKPDWQTVCPPDVCPLGTFMKSDCTCTSPYDPCDACPLNTRCQTFPSLMCIDCSCGFCDDSLTGCCEYNGQNDCMIGPGLPEQCAMMNNNFPAFAGYGYVCGGVETSRTSLPNGCGCQPTPHSPCTYNRDWGTREEKCYVCTASDLAEGESCEACKDCLSNCPNSDCISTSSTVEDFMLCLHSISDVYCRASCHYSCMKN